MAMAAPRREESTSAETVTVACSLPMGATLYLEQKFKMTEAVMGGGIREIEQYRKVGEPVYLKGTRNRAGTDDADSPIADGFALTYNVNKEFMDTFFEQSSDWHPVRMGMIKYARNPGDMKAMTKENANHRTGLEPMNPKGDPRNKSVKAFVRD